MGEHPDALILTAGPLRLPLTETLEGPKVAGSEPFERALRWVLDAFNQDPDLKATVARGDPFYAGPIEITSCAGGELESGSAAWKDRTGEDLGEPAVSVRVGSALAVLPRAVLFDAAERLGALQQAQAVDPPWLFRPDPRGSVPHPSERALLLGLEQPPADLAEHVLESERQRLGLHSLEEWESKLRALLSWGAVGLARDYVSRVRAADPANPPQSPWLFRIGPHWDLAHPSERKLITELDREAEAIEVVERSLEGAAEPPELIAHRSRYLERLRDAGLLSADQREAKLHQLHLWGAERLAALYEAALRGLDYLSSPARAKYNPDAKETDLVSAPVCLDIFRGLKVPENVTEFAWISWGEHLLRTHGPKHDVQAEQGEFPYHDKDGLVMVLWRKDVGIPALRYVALKPPVIDTSLIREWLA